MKAPGTQKGKRLVYEETFRTPGAKPTPEEARKVLEKIRANHPREFGWVEFSGTVEYYGGGWHAVRHHAQYKE